MLKKLFVAPATIQLAGAEVELVSVVSRETMLKKALAPVRDEYDFIIIDLSTIPWFAYFKCLLQRQIAY